MEEEYQVSIDTELSGCTVFSCIYYSLCSQHIVTNTSLVALFGRSGCQAVSFASLAFLFILGITQSDLLLFYFAFIIFFQSELEIPIRNEVDGVPLTSAVIASFAGFLMLLTLIPM